MHTPRWAPGQWMSGRLSCVSSLLTRTNGGMKPLWARSNGSTSLHSPLACFAQVNAAFICWTHQSSLAAACSQPGLQDLLTCSYAVFCLFILPVCLSCASWSAGCIVVHLHLLRLLQRDRCITEKLGLGKSQLESIVFGRLLRLRSCKHVA